MEGTLSSWRPVYRLLVITTFCAVGISSCNSLTLHKEPDLPELPYANNLQEVIDQVLLANPDYDLGISAAVLVPGYRTWEGASGYSHQDVPISTDMLFDVGSVQKNFEAALVLKLVEEGMLSLDDPISKYLPTYNNVDGRITIRQLLNHTSGVFNVFEHPDFPWIGSYVDYSKSWPIEHVFDQFVLEPYGPPGYTQHYSSTNYLLLTEIIEGVTGNTVPDEIETRFLKPMQLERTFVSMGEAPPDKYLVAHPWVDIDQDGTLEDLYEIPLTWKVTLTHPVMFSTPADLARWMNAIYYDRTVLNPQSHEEMLAFPETTLPDPEGGLYGLGVIDFTERLGVPVLGHGGSSLGYSAAALYLPEYSISIAWLVNTGENPPELANQIMSDTWSSLYKVISIHQERSP